MMVVLLPLLLLLFTAVIVPATLLSPPPLARPEMLQPLLSALPLPPPPPPPTPSFCVSFRRIRMPGSHSRRAARDEDEGRPVRVLFVVDETIFDLRSGKVSITRSRNSSRAPTSFCNSCSDLVWSVT
uniref:Putative secreted protein n=1 Tax=Anopheles darlingi TaxID=43151 RepID=A0A2M4DBA3_ANODA